MITRGHFIGEIVDELSAVASQIAMRSKLGLLDLNVFSESFFKDVLNAIYGWQLQGLNQSRSNEPGLDLGDESHKVAVQVTSRSDATKVNSTLTKITADQAKKYSTFFVLVAGEKRSTYKLDAKLSSKYNFQEKNILDVQDLCRKTLDLPIDKLQHLHRTIRTNVAKVLIELEVPDPDTGKFPTSGFDKWEVKPEAKVGDGQKFAAWVEEESNTPLTPKEIENVRKDLIMLGHRLRRLPRVTREFLVMLLERKSPRKSTRFTDAFKTVRLDTVEREYGGGAAELKGELGLLEDEGFVQVNGEESYEHGEPEIGMRIPADTDDLAMGFLEYVKAKKLDLRNVLGQIDLSGF